MKGAQLPYRVVQTSTRWLELRPETEMKVADFFVLLKKLITQSVKNVEWKERKRHEAKGGKKDWVISSDISQLKESSYQNTSRNSHVVMLFITNCYKIYIKVKVKLSPCFNEAPRHEGVLGKWRYISTHSLISALDGGEWSASRFGRFTPRGRFPATHWIGDWVGPRAVRSSKNVSLNIVGITA